MCLAEVKTMRFHEIGGEEDIAYKTFVICLHFISPHPYFLVEIYVIVWLAKHVTRVQTNL